MAISQTDWTVASDSSQLVLTAPFYVSLWLVTVTDTSNR